MAIRINSDRLLPALASHLLHNPIHPHFPVEGKKTSPSEHKHYPIQFQAHSGGSKSSSRIIAPRPGAVPRLAFCAMRGWGGGGGQLGGLQEIQARERAISWRESARAPAAKESARAVATRKRKRKHSSAVGWQYRRPLTFALLAHFLLPQARRAEEPRFFAKNNIRASEHQPIGRQQRQQLGCSLWRSAVFFFSFLFGFVARSFFRAVFCNL